MKLIRSICLSQSERHNVSASLIFPRCTSQCCERGEISIIRVGFSRRWRGVRLDSLPAFRAATHSNEPRSLHLRYAKQSLSSPNLCSAPCEHHSEHHQRSQRFNSPLREKQSAPSHPRSTAAHSNRRNRKEVLTEDNGCTCRKRLYRAEHAKQKKRSP